MTTTRKGAFGAVPDAALRDDSLTSLDLRVLGVIAWHGRSGTGCYASNETLADRVGCHPKAVSRCITRLSRQGHIRDVHRKAGTQRSRSRMLVVVYEAVPDPHQAPAPAPELYRPVEFEPSAKSIAVDLKSTLTVDTRETEGERVALEATLSPAKGAGDAPPAAPLGPEERPPRLAGYPELLAFLREEQRKQLEPQRSISKGLLLAANARLWHRHGGCR